MVLFHYAIIFPANISILIDWSLTMLRSLTNYVQGNRKKVLGRSNPIEIEMFSLQIRQKLSSIINHTIIRQYQKLRHLINRKQKEFCQNSEFLTQ